MWVKQQQLEVDMEPQTGSKLEKEYIQAVYCHPAFFFFFFCLFNLYAENIMRNAGLDEAWLESRLLGEISLTSRMQRTPNLWQKVKKNKNTS